MLKVDESIINAEKRNKPIDEDQINRIDREFKDCVHSAEEACNKIMKPGDVCYTCECFSDDLLMCKFCFEFNLSKHSGHRYRKTFLENGGTCDCVEISGDQCKICYKEIPFKFTKEIMNYIKKVVNDFVKFQIVELNEAHLQIPQNETYSIIVFHNYSEMLVNMEIILKKTNLRLTYQDVYNLIDKCILNGQMTINRNCIDKDMTLDKTARLFSKYQFYSLTKEQLAKSEKLRKEFKEIIQLLKYKEIRSFIGRILKDFHVKEFYTYCKNGDTIDYYDHDFKKYIDSDLGESNHFNFLLFNILRIQPLDSVILYDMFINLLEEEENKIIIGNIIIDNYMNNVDYYLSGYGNILNLNKLTSLIFTDNNIITKLNHPFMRLVELVPEFQRRYDTIEPGENSYTPTRREAYRTVIEQLYMNLNFLIGLPDVLTNYNYEEMIKRILDIMDGLMHDKIVGDNHLMTKRELFKHIDKDIVNLSQGPLFRSYLYKMITNLNKVFQPNGVYNYHNLKLILDRIIFGNTQLMIECYNNQDIRGDNGYLMFLYEHLFASILFTMNSNELNSFYSDLFNECSQLLVYDENEKIQSCATTTEPSENMMFNDNNFSSGEMEVDESQQTFRTLLDENDMKRMMPLKTIPLPLFGSLRFSLTIVQHKSNLWVKNGLMFTAKVKSCCSPFNYELMFHFLQFMLSFTDTERILKLLEVVFSIYTGEHNYLDQDDVNLNYYTEFLTFILTLLTNGIPLYNSKNNNNNNNLEEEEEEEEVYIKEEENNNNIENDMFGEYIKVDIIHLLLEKKYTFDDIVNIICEKYFHVNVDDLKSIIIQQLDIISDYNSVDGMYSLKKQYNYYYNPYYLSILPNQNMVDNSNSLFSDHSEFKPFPLLYNSSSNKCLMNLYNVIYSVEYNEIIKTNLQYFQNNMNNQSNSKVFTILQPTLWMIIIEVEEKEGLEVDVTNLKNINTNNNNKTFTILLKYKNDTVFGKQIQYILKRFDELGIIIDEGTDGMNNNNNNNNGDESKETIKKSKRKYESILNRMKSKQQRVAMKIEMEEEDDNNDNGEGDEDENSRNNGYDNLAECVICKSTTTFNVNTGQLVLPVTIIPVISYTSQTITLKWAIPIGNNNNNKINVKNENDGISDSINNKSNNNVNQECPRNKIISCNHIMHLKCLNESAERSFFQKVLQQMVSPVDVKRREYTCPICRGVYNLCLVIPNHCNDHFLPRLIERGEESEYIYWKASILNDDIVRTIKPYIDREKRYYIELYHDVKESTIQSEQQQQQQPPPPTQNQQQQQQEENNTVTLITTSLGSVPLPYDNEIIHNYPELYSILSTTIIDSAYSLNANPEKKIDYFMIKCLLFNCQYFLSTQYPHIYDKKEFSLQSNPNSYVEMLLYHIFTCADSESIFTAFVTFLYKCLCSYYDNNNNSIMNSKIKKNRQVALKRTRNDWLKGMSNKLLEYNNLDDFYRNCGEYYDLYHKILDPFDFEMRIVFIIYHSFNSNNKCDESEIPRYDFIKCFINFDLPKIINDYVPPSDDNRLKLYPPLEHPVKCHLIDLPMNNNTEELMTRYLRECKYCKTVPENPGLCLICGEILCPNSICCEHNKIGEVTSHCMKYHGGLGITLSLTNYKIYLTRFKYTLEYMQLYIKDDPKQGEEEIKNRYNMLEEMFESDNIFETVFQKIDITPYYIIHNAF